MSIDGYGASIDYDGTTVVITGGRVQAKAWGADKLTIPVADLIEIHYRAANMMINGELQFTARHPAYTYADAGKLSMPDNGLVIHWRKKDQPAFEALYNALPQVTVTPQERSVILAQRREEREADMRAAA